MTNAAEPAPIHHDRDALGGRYWIAFPGDEAEMTYRLSGGVMAIDHTYSPPAARGQGLAERLIRRAVADARAEGLKIAPLCSYAAAQFARHPDWSDLLPG